MFDVLVYLFENYIHAEACPAPEQLARRLTAAGFEDEEINEALDWLSGLNHAASENRPVGIPSDASIRVYIDEEMRRLGPEGQGFVAFLEAAGVIDAHSRELILDRIFALPDGRVSLSRLKVIVLMVLWNQARPMDTLILDELLTEDDDGESPTLQ